MSRLDELIKELCPDGVEYKTLGEVCEIKTGNKPEKIYDEKNSYEYINAGTTNSGFTDIYNCEGDTLTTPSRGQGGIGFVGYQKDNFFLGPLCYKIQSLDKTVALTKYIFYYLQSNNDMIFKIKNEGGVPSVNRVDLIKLEIAVPPLPVQAEIVRSMDNFTELIVELTAELTARKKQYEYYRNSLLTFGEEVPMVTLGEFATIVRGGNFQKKDFAEIGVPCIHYGQIYTKYGLFATETITFINQTVAKKSKFASKNDIVMAVTSENIIDVCKCVVWLGEEDAAISGHTAIIKHNQNSKFLAYYFHTAMFFRDKIKLAHGTKVIEVTPSKLADIKIPLPPIEEQQRIVDILDRFDTLCNDISSGLPAEIKARQQQYEYYRDKLLTFPKADAAVEV